MYNHATLLTLFSSFISIETSQYNTFIIHFNFTEICKNIQQIRIDTQTWNIAVVVEADFCCPPFRLVYGTTLVGLMSKKIIEKFSVMPSIMVSHILILQTIMDLLQDRRQVFCRNCAVLRWRSTRTHVNKGFPNDQASR